MNVDKSQQKLLKLLVETEPTPVVTKSKHTDNSSIILGGIFMEAGKKNSNGRMYDVEDLNTAVEEFLPMIESGRALSELEHSEATVINPDRACARITSLKRKGNQFLGEAVVLAANPSKGIAGTPCGTLLASLLQYGTNVGWSSRGLGELDESGNVKDFHLVTIDCVLNPSTGYMSKNTANRFVDGVLESANFVIGNHTSTQLIYEAFTKNISKLPVDATEKHAKITKAIEQFLTAITG